MCRERLLFRSGLPLEGFQGFWGKYAAVLVSCGSAPKLLPPVSADLSTSGAPSSCRWCTTRPYVSRGRRVRSREKAKKRISGESLLYGWVNEGEGEIYFKSSTIKEISVAATCEARLLE